MDEYTDLYELKQNRNNIDPKNLFNYRFLIAGLIYFVIFILPHILFGLIPADETVATTEPSESDLLFGTALNFIIYAIVTGAFFALLYKYYWKEIKGFFNRPGYNTLVAVIGWVVGIVTMMILGIIMTYALGICNSSENQQAIEDSLAYPLLIIPPVVLLAPIVEETFFRGILFKYLTKISSNKYISVGIALAVSSFLFGFIHIIGEVLAGNFSEFVQILPYMGLGLILAIVYYITDNLLVPILMHIIQNSFSIIMSYLLLLLPEIPEDTTNTCELMVRAFLALVN